MSIVIEHLSYVYMPKTPYEKKALDDISLTVREGEFLGIIGHTGSGKSTFIQCLNKLITTTQGKITVFGRDINDKKIDLKWLRSTVGMVFQYPEAQLFEETVEKDVAFGPKNLQLSPEEIRTRVENALNMVGLPYQEYAKRSPFELSGGQKRRVAIAGVIAMQPKVFILDEPTAGLDPRGKKEILALIKRLQVQSPTIIMISHDMDEISAVADRIAVFNNGKLEYILPPKELFRHRESLQALHLDIPQVTKIAGNLIDAGIPLPDDIITPDEFMQAVLRLYQERR